MMHLKSAAIADLLGQLLDQTEVLNAIETPQFETVEALPVKDWRHSIPLHMRAKWKLYSVEAQLAAYIVAYNLTIDER